MKPVRFATHPWRPTVTRHAGKRLLSRSARRSRAVWNSVANATLNLRGGCRPLRQRTSARPNLPQPGMGYSRTKRGDAGYLKFYPVPRTDLDPRDQDPLYVQLAEILRDMIVSGEIPPRTALPSKTTLAQRYGISGQTIDGAMRLLREEGLIVTVMGKGIYVSERKHWRNVRGSE